MILLETDRLTQKLVSVGYFTDYVRLREYVATHVNRTTTFSAWIAPDGTMQRIHAIPELILPIGETHA